MAQDMYRPSHLPQDPDQWALLDSFLATCSAMHNSIPGYDPSPASQIAPPQAAPPSGDFQLAPSFPSEPPMPPTQWMSNASDAMRIAYRPAPGLVSPAPSHPSDTRSGSIGSVCSMMSPPLAPFEQASAPGIYQSGSTGANYLSQTRKRTLPSDPTPVVGPASKSPRVESTPQLASSSPSPQVLGARTSVRIFHAGVAQKHYGQEKRPLCPPPMVIVDGPCCSPAHGGGPSATLTILDDHGAATCSQPVADVRGQVNYFRSLHTASNLDKVHKFEMELSLFHPANNLRASPPLPGMPPPFASFRSDVGMISKPSRKTGRARDIKATILNGSLVCCWTRPSLQASRMQMMCFENGRLASRTSQWSPLIISVVRRAESAGHSDEDAFFLQSTPGAEQTVTYGSVITLTDSVTGARSPPLIVRKVSKTKTRLRASRTASGPIGILQKVALVAAEAETEGYLSASFLVERPTTSRRSTTATPSPDVAMPCLPATRDPLDPSEDEIQEGFSWTMVSIAEQTHTFYDAPSNTSIDRPPITPFPTVIGTPTIDFAANILSFFISASPADIAAFPTSLSIGSSDPLPAQVKRTQTAGGNAVLQIRCALPAMPSQFSFAIGGPSTSHSPHLHSRPSPPFDVTSFRQSPVPSEPQRILISRSDGITYALPFAVVQDQSSNPFSPPVSMRLVKV